MAKTLYSKEYKRLVQRLKKIRLERGLNQVEVGKLLKKDQTFISKVEAGQYRLDAMQLNQLAKIYKKILNIFCHKVAFYINFQKNICNSLYPLKIRKT